MECLRRLGFAIAVVVAGRNLRKVLRRHKGREVDSGLGNPFLRGSVHRREKGSVSQRWCKGSWRQASQRGKAAPTRRCGSVAVLCTMEAVVTA
ncbi:hypothetical protein VIGAN_11076600 [Vigna angularis var. angularis]|uniref:Uncharacterized protein n=1 Tax=Vigna angularis var. angularis TaxID=157739 RepID=A0A0S3T8D0_PHAAN|nr:hypothetical protein VIGAN_11076600 [Vigna angularis var. angularis]